MVPKSILSDKIVLDVPTDIAVCVYNEEFFSILHITEAMDLEIDPDRYEVGLEMDKQRIKIPERSLFKVIKEARIVTRSS